MSMVPSCIPESSAWMSPIWLSEYTLTLNLPFDCALTTSANFCIA